MALSLKVGSSTSPIGDHVTFVFCFAYRTKLQRKVVSRRAAKDDCSKPKIACVPASLRHCVTAFNPVQINHRIAFCLGGVANVSAIGLGPAMEPVNRLRLPRSLAA